MAVSALKTGLLPIAQTAMRFGDVAYHDYEGPALNLDERERLVKDLGDHEAMILRNHGLLTVGPTIAECFNNMFRLERACQLQVMTLSCNAEIQLAPNEIVKQTQDGFKPGARRRWGLLEWPALLRKLDKVDPSYRD
jgi:ribulose-5-phosphate 4-epimerase/fuculose-1-phosphate aldolase